MPAKLLAVASLLLASTAFAAPDVFTNPILQPRHPDPGVLFWNGTYYLVATTEAGADAFPIYSSPDGVHWTSHGHVFPDWSRNKNPSWAMSDFWAPELHVMQTNPPLFNVYFSARRASDRKLVIGVATGKTPIGPFTDSGQALAEDERTGAIDATWYYDTPSKQAYLIWKIDGNDIREPTPILAQKIDSTGTKLSGARTQLLTNDQAWEVGVAEGPWMVHVHGYYWLFYAGGVFDQVSYATGIARSKNLLGPYEKLSAGARGVGNPIIRTPEEQLRTNTSWSGPGHCSIIPMGVPREQGADNHTWSLFCHAWPQNWAGRASVLMTVDWTAIPDPAQGAPWPSVRGGKAGAEVVGLVPEGPIPVPK